jgi:DNA-binding YbaB/EbfC family protein
MLEELKDMGKLLKQAKEMKNKMKKVQDELKKVRVTSASKDGKIAVIMSGELEVVELKIDPSYLNPSQAKNFSDELQKLFNAAANKAKEIASGKLSEISGGLNIPGLTD